MVDNISAALLEGKHCEVLDLEFTGGAAKTVTTDAAGAVPAAPPVADVALIATIIGDGGGYKLTMKKLRLKDSVVESIARDTGSGGLSAIDRMAEMAALKLVPPPPPPQVARKLLVIEGFYQPRPPAPPPAPLPMPDDMAGVPEAISPSSITPARLAAIEAAKAQARRQSGNAEPQRAGRITDVSDGYSFCVISPGKEVTMQVGDRISTWTSRDPQNVVELTITSVEDGKVVANFPAGKEGSLNKGDYVYQWK